MVSVNINLKLVGVGPPSGRIRLVTVYSIYTLFTWRAGVSLGSVGAFAQSTGALIDVASELVSVLVYLSTWRAFSSACGLPVGSASAFIQSAGVPADLASGPVSVRVCLSTW